ncbi:MAG: hypothetical protein M3Q08_10615 [Pseudomonadota bacterium]|nr:hypothetical protein [Pseudomonadota bacterium]
MRKVAVALLMALAPAGALHAQSMPISDFLTRAEALKKKGLMATVSKDLGVLKAEIQNSGKQLRAEQNEAAKAGRKPATCMPKKASFGPDELLGHLRSIPPQQRSMSIKAGLAGLMRKKYPCPA